MKLIDKDALVAEIEKFEKALKNACKPNPFGNVEECMTAAELQALDVVKETINTLEVKEVDLEKELIEWHKEHFQKSGTFIGMSGFYLTNSSQMELAKNFFELGMSGSNKAQKGEEVGQQTTLNQYRLWPLQRTASILLRYQTKSL